MASMLKIRFPLFILLAMTLSVFAGICLPVDGVDLRAQTAASDAAETGKNSEGTEFWICFQRNYRDFDVDRDNNPIKRTDELELNLFLTAKQNALVAIEIDGIAFKREVNVRAGTVVNVAIDSAAQLRGSDEIERLGVHITSDVPIAVYGLNRRFQTTDTYLALPVNVLGTEYMAMCYDKLSSELISQVALIATEDNTVVTITPTTATGGGHPEGEPYKVLLQEGDVYQFNAAYDRRSRADLTGTLIQADKKIAVFSGHNCAHVPAGTRACNLLVEQLPPMHSWGRHFFLGTLANRSTSTWRVLASEPNTTVFEDQKKIAVLNAGEFYEKRNFSENTQIKADKPVMVAEFAQGFQNGDSIGDPMMIIVSPSQQFRDSYLIATPVDGSWQHYLNIVMPGEGTSSLRINGRKIPQREFQRFGRSSYFIGQFQIPLGTHLIEADLPFGLYSYGFGLQRDAWDAYGNMGGQNFGVVENLPDSLAPAVEGLPAGDSLQVLIRDERPFDRGLQRVDIISAQNISIELPKVESGAPLLEAGVTAIKANVFGRAVMRAIDLAGNAADFSICYRYDPVEGEYGFVVQDGATADCSPEKLRYWGAYANLSFNAWTADFGSTGEISTPGRFGDASGMGGVIGGLVGIQLTPAFGATARLSIDTYGGELLAPDSLTTLTPPPDQRVVQEAGVLTLDNAWLSLGLSGEYYLTDRFYFTAGVQTSFALGTGVTLKRRILTPSGLVYSESNENEFIQYEDGLGSIAPIRLALTGGVGMTYPIVPRIKAFVELRQTAFLTDVVDDADWGQSQTNINFGARVQF